MPQEEFANGLAALKARRDAIKNKDSAPAAPPSRTTAAPPSTSQSSSTSSRILAPESSPTTSPAAPSKFFSTAPPPANGARMLGERHIPSLGGGPTMPIASSSHTSNGPPPRKKQAFHTASNDSLPSSTPGSPTSQSSAGGGSFLASKLKGQTLASASASASGRSSPQDVDMEYAEEGESSLDVAATPETKPQLNRFKRRTEGEAVADMGADDTPVGNGNAKPTSATPDEDPLGIFSSPTSKPKHAPSASSHQSIAQARQKPNVLGPIPGSTFYSGATTASLPPGAPQVNRALPRPPPPQQPSQTAKDERNPLADFTYATRLATVYAPSNAALNKERILEIMGEYPMDSLATISKRVSALSRGQDYKMVGMALPGLLARNSSSSGMIHVETPPHHRELMRNMPSSSGSLGSSPAPVASKMISYRKPPKESAIYSNRKAIDLDADDTDSVTSGGRSRGVKRKGGGGGGGFDSDSDDGDDYREGGRKKKGWDEPAAVVDEETVLKVFNECKVGELTGSIACNADQEASIIALRPYASVEDLRKKLGKRKGVSFGLFEQYQNVMQGYIEVDRCLTKCETIGNEISEIMNVWTKGKAKAGTPSTSRQGTPASETADADAGMHIASVDKEELAAAVARETNPRRKKVLQRYQFKQPRGIKDGVNLKDYQIVGLNWLALLHTMGHSCILADEMGLGKTIQVISFFIQLKERNVPGPHLVVVPSSTLENWVREFEKFAGEGIDVQTYYGSQAERYGLRKDYQKMYEKGKLEVLITTYDMAWRADDHKFLRKKIQFNCAVFDEGHTLKNCTSQRYESLIAIKPQWRLLLTGTPLQNNLQELVSLLNFILPEVFDEAEDALRQIFKVAAKGHVNLLSQQRVSRARTMLTPFVLRRRKAQVLKDLPPRSDKVMQCKMTPTQRYLYDNSLRRSRTIIEEALKEEEEKEDVKPKKGKKAAVLKQKDDSSSNVLMDLRKASNHPLLFRHVYNDKVIKQVARACMNEPEFCDSVYEMIIEDMEVMSDAELYFFCKRYKSVNKHAIPIKHFLNVGKVKAVEMLLARCEAEGRRMLLFSQFTQVLDILQVVLEHMGKKYIRLDGSTKVDQRQGLVDEFTDNEEIKVFLLSTRAGGMGINLVAASVVCIYDQDFNPHNDRQAADRAYRIGQTREVQVIKLLSENTIDEDIYRLGVTKLKLDDAVGGGNAGATSDTIGEASDDSNPTAKEVKKSLLTTIKTKADEIEAAAATQGGVRREEAEVGSDEDEDVLGDDDVKMEDA